MSLYFIFYILKKKIFLLLYFINWPNSIVRLPLIGEILGNKECRIQTQNDSSQPLWAPETYVPTSE